MNGIGVTFQNLIRPMLLSALTMALASVTVMGKGAYGKDQKITAAYSINFNGISIGDFKLVSNFWKGNYEMKARASISLLGGLLFEWRGNTESTGRLTSNRPRPDSFSFVFKTSDKRGKIDVAFANDRVAQLAINPPQSKSSRRIPVTRAHMRSVVDPLSAVVMLSKTGLGKNGRQVCNDSIPIFDGNARYDLKLSYKGARQVSSRNFKGKAYVCKVKFVPIAGHKRGDDESEFAAKTNDIEVWMIPLRKAGIYVPHYIQIPTQIGTASLSASRFNVEPVGRKDAMLSQ